MIKTEKCFKIELMKFAELKQHLKSGSVHSAYFAIGEDAFLVANTISRFKELITQVPEMNISVFDSEQDTQRIVSACECLPVMSDKRLVIVSDFKGDADKLATYLKAPNPSTILLFSAYAVKESVSKILQYFTVIDCAHLDENTILSFIAKTSADLGCSFKKDAASLLISFCNADLSRISRETEKLCLYKKDGLIEASDVTELVKPEYDYKIYELSEAVAAKNNIKAAQILKTLLSDKFEPVSLLGMIYSHFRRLLFCLISKNEENLDRLLGVKSFAVQKAIAQASKYSALRLKKICDLLSEADYNFKSGLISDVLALEVCIIGILSEGGSN